MLFNAQKCNHLIVGTAAALAEEADAAQRVSMNGEVVPPSTAAGHKHLGAIVYNRLLWKEHIEYAHSACPR